VATTGRSCSCFYRRKVSYGTCSLKVRRAERRRRRLLRQLRREPFRKGTTGFGGADHRGPELGQEPLDCGVSEPVLRPGLRLPRHDEGARGADHRVRHPGALPGHHTWDLHPRHCELPPRDTARRGRMAEGQRRQGIRQRRVGKGLSLLPRSPRIDQLNPCRSGREGLGWSSTVEASKVLRARSGLGTPCQSS